MTYVLYIAVQDSVPLSSFAYDYNRLSAISSIHRLQEENIRNAKKLEELKGMVEELKGQLAKSDEEKQLLYQRCKQLENKINEINSSRRAPQPHTIYSSGGPPRGDSLPGFGVVAAPYRPPVYVGTSLNLNPSMPVPQPYPPQNDGSPYPYLMQPGPNPYQGRY